MADVVKGKPILHKQRSLKPSESPNQSSPQPSSSNQSGDGQNNQSNKFHNPYNFVPALPRNIEESKMGELGDRPPVGHDCYLNDHWSGSITCILATITPLLIPDAAKVTKVENAEEHYTYPLRRVDDKPYLPPTSIKGMLRAAYEAVTNSRLSVFEQHSDRLAYRMVAQNVTLVPARVESRNEQLVLRIMQEPDVIGHTGKLPRYPRGLSNSTRQSRQQQTSNINVPFPLPCENSNELPHHGDRVWVRLNPNGANRIQQSVITRILRREDNSEPPGSGNWRKGWVSITNENIKGKKYERVFIESDDNRTIPVTDQIKELWRELIQNYQDTHEKDLKKRDKEDQKCDEYLGDNPGETAWSRHICEAGASQLQENTLCYVEFNENNQVKALLPVMLSRRLYAVPPDRLLDSSLQPATDIKDLSPGERVFGWVNQLGKGAYKGQLRISSVQYEKCYSSNENDPIERFEGNGVPLAILGQPKPQQFRFYAAKNREGEPLTNGTTKSKGYQENHGLRGRKVYPHHRGVPQSYWQKSTAEGTQHEVDGRYLEYRRLIDNGENRDNQNRSIKEWVKPGVEFKFEIDVVNLSPVELGALLWLLQLPKYESNDCFHRLGGGKPLGFGSVRIKVDWKNEKTDLRTGQEWRKFYSSLIIDKPEQLTEPDAEQLVNTFREAVAKAYNNQWDFNEVPFNEQHFKEVPFIAAFLKAAQGFDDGKPIYYPRTQSEPNPAGEGFEWFTANESTDGKKLSLPYLVEDKGLPWKPT